MMASVRLRRLASSWAPRMIRPASGVVAISSVTRPTSPDAWVRRPRAKRFGWYPSLPAASRTRAFVSSLVRV